MIELLNRLGCLANVGDRRAHTIPAAEDYIADRLLRSYREHRFGLYLMELKEAANRAGCAGWCDAIISTCRTFPCSSRSRAAAALEAARAVLQ